MRSSEDPTAVALAAQVGWVRRLARELVRDEHLAEDLAQETVAVALEHPPREAKSTRSFLATVLHNLWRQRLRGDGRRAARESDAARHEAQPSTAHLVEEVARHRELSEALIALEEPFRGAVLLRFFEGLPPRKIAARLDVPVATVNSRLRRGLAKLRERLDHEHDGDRHAWLALFLPLAERSAAPVGALSLSAATTGALIVNTKLALPVLACLVAGGWLALRGGVSDARPVDAEPAAVTTALDASALNGTGAPSARPTSAALEADLVTRSAASAPQAPTLGAAAPTTPGAGRWTVRGRVLDADGMPAPGVALRLGGEGDEELASSPVARSVAGGDFAFESALESGTLLAASEDHVTVQEAVFRRGASIEPALVVAPAIELGGVVVDELGRPLEGAYVTLRMPDDFGTRFAQKLDASRSLGWRTTSDADGRFSLGRVPAVAGATVRAVLEGYLLDEQPTPATTSHALHLALARPEEQLEGGLSGRVVDADGAPVPDARVALGLQVVRTDAAGEFQLDLARAVTAHELVAVKAGQLPARMERPGASTDTNGGWPSFCVLELGGPPLSIEGRVVDTAGRPVAGARVWLADPSPFGPIGMMPTQLESLVAGAEVPAMAVESAANLPAEDGDSYWDWHEQAGPPTAFWNWVACADDGRFTLSGLQDRRYTLKAMDPNTLVQMQSEPVRAGARGAELLLPAERVHEQLVGRVVDPAGRPLPDVRVRLSAETFGRRARVFGGSSLVSLNQPGGATTTDADGRFELANVPREGVELSFMGDAILPASRALSSDDDPRDLRVQVDVRCHLSLELEELAGAADELRVLDGEGRRLDVLFIRGGSITALSDAPIQGDRTGILSVSSAARTGVLLLAGEEVDRFPLDLDPSEVTELRR